MKENLLRLQIDQPLGEMVKRCQKDKTIKAVIVHKIDGFSRNNIDFTLQSHLERGRRQAFIPHGKTLSLRIDTEIGFLT
ncbi:MAG: hypothetical protein ACUVUS_08230 [Thermoproteota archaeon]